MVEDDPLLIDIYTTKLKEAGFQVTVVEHGQKVLSALEKERPDVVLLDIVLPHMDGWEVLRAIKANDSLKEIPVVILSNLGQKEEINKGLQLGAARYFIKAHYTPSQIVEELATII